METIPLQVKSSHRYQEYYCHNSITNLILDKQIWFIYNFKSKKLVYILNIFPLIDKSYFISYAYVLQGRALLIETSLSFGR